MLLFTDASIPRVQKFLDQLLSAGGAVELTYGFTDVGRGRLYDHLGLQFISRAALHCLYAGPDVVDLDVINCNPIIVYELLVADHGAPHVHAHYPYLTRLALDRDGLGGVMEETKTFYGVSRKEAKQLGNLLLNGGAIATWRASVVTGAGGNSAWALGMHAEAPLVRAAVVALRSTALVVVAAYAAWASRHAANPALLHDAHANANFTFTYVVQDVENQILVHTIVPAVQTYGGRVSSLHFDGLIAALQRSLGGPRNLSFTGLRDAVNAVLAARGTLLRVAIKDWELPPGIDIASLQQSPTQIPTDARPLPDNSPHREFLLRALGLHCGDLTSAYVGTYDGCVALQAGGLGRRRQQQRHHHIFRTVGPRQCPHRVSHMGGDFELVEDGSRLLYLCKDPGCAARPSAEVCEIPVHIFATDRRVVSSRSFDAATAERALANIIKVKQGEVANSDSDSDHVGLPVVDGRHIRPATRQAALRAMGEYVNRFFVAIERGGRGDDLARSSLAPRPVGPL